MIDYIQLMKGQTKAENRSLEVGEISRFIKLLAKDLEVTGYCLFTVKP